MTTNDAFPEAFREQLVAELKDAGWDRFPFDGPLSLTFTRQLGGGFQAVIRVTGSSGGHPGPPTLADVDTGVGYEPATALMPRLTLRPSPLLVPTGEEPEEPDAYAPEIALGSDHDLDRFRARVVELARDHAVPLARQYAVLDEMEAALRAELEDFPEAAIERLPVFLAATGRPDEALSQVEQFLASDLDDVLERDYRRFARQLRLWADAGAPPPPALTSWPPDAFELPWRDRARTGQRERRAERNATRATLNAVRKLARGKARSELVALLTAEYAGRGLDVPPAATVMQAGMLELEQRPFGKVRAGLAAFKTMARVTRDAAGFRDAFHERPSWLEPPDDALFEVPSAHRSWISVRIAPEAAEWLARVAAEANPTPQLLTHCEAWLRPVDGAEHIDVLIGEQRVGRLEEPDAETFRPALVAAACYHELPVVRAQLLWSGDEAERSLAIARPEPVPQPPPF